MILEFSIQNYRSFKDEQTFSLPVSTPSAGVYGANASGKSNFLRAFDTLRFLVEHSYSWDEKNGISMRCFDPYRLDSGSEGSPVEFSIEFSTQGGHRFLYEVAFTRMCVEHERLSRRLSEGKKKVLFSRHSKNKALKGENGQPISFFRNQCYLSVAGFNAGASEWIRAAYSFFKRGVMHLAKNTEITPFYPGNESAIHEKHKKNVSLIPVVDVGIDRIELKKINEAVPQQQKGVERYSPVFYHGGRIDKPVPFALSDESEGTQRLYNRLPLIIDALEAGGVLVIDELENSLHPFICELIIRLFNDPEVNRHGAQLIFSTHDVSLLSKKLLGPEQIWFTEKVNGATTLFSLADFDKKEVSADSPIGQWYEEGRFGAFPRYNWHKIKQLFVGGAKNG